MGQFPTDDGRYLIVIDDPADGNTVFYDTQTDPWTVLADRLSYEAGHGTVPDTPVDAPPSPAEPLAPSSVSRLIRVTDANDGELLNRGYSYWSQVWLLSPREAIAFCGHEDGHPRFFKVNLESGEVERLGSRLDQFGYFGTGEGLYFDREGRITFTDGPRLRRVDPFGVLDETIFSIEAEHPGCRLWQAHSTEDGQTHSATVQQITSDGPYRNIGTVVFWHGDQEYFPARGTLDESQLTAYGGFLIIKEDNDNRIITLGTRETRLLRDADGAVGHSDCGDGFVVGEDDQHGACVFWDLRQPLTPERRRELFRTWDMGHVSVRGARCLLSDEKRLSLVAFDGSGMTPLLEHGMMGSGYDFQVFANLDPTGTVAAYLSNAAGRMDLYLYVI